MKKKAVFFVAILSSVLVFITGCQNNNEPDTTPPQISISSPANNSIVKDTVTIKATVSDNDGISKVEFLVDGNTVGSVNKSPYEFNWDSKQVENGFHTLQCKAVDKSNNEALSNVVTVTVSNYLFKATFTNNWVKDDEQCVIFISDKNGNVLAEKSFTGNASFEMYAENSSGIDKISVTTVVYDGYSSNITTNLNIPVGSAWTWKGKPYPDHSNPYSVNFNFQNIPEHIGYVLSSKWYAHISIVGTIWSPYDFKFFESPANIYLKLNTVNDGVKYVWINDVTPGSRDVDLSNMTTAAAKTINFSGAIRCSAFLYGIANPGHRYEGKYGLDYCKDSNDVAKVYYPDNYFTDYKTSLYYYDESGSYDFYYQAVYGEIPGQFTKINADFNFVGTSYDNFEIAASGDFIEIASYWRENNARWLIYSDKTDTKYKLPALPDSVVQQFGIDRESFKLDNAEIMKPSGLNSYYDILNLLFNSDNYFYDVVNDVRIRVKYSNGKAEKNVNGNTKFYDTYEEPYLRY